MKTKKLISGLTASLILVLSLFTTAVVHANTTAKKHLVPFQGRLNDEAGNALNGVYQLQFRLYDAETAGEKIWDETHDNVSVINGYVNVLLGDQKLLKVPDTNFPNDRNRDIAIDFSQKLYLGVTIGKYIDDSDRSQVAQSNELLPRHQLVPSFHAVTADKADHAETATLATNATNLTGNSGSETLTYNVETIKEVKANADAFEEFSGSITKKPVQGDEESFYYEIGNATNATSLGGTVASDYALKTDVSSVPQLKAVQLTETNRYVLTEYNTNAYHFPAGFDPSNKLFFISGFPKEKTEHRSYQVNFTYMNKIENTTVGMGFQAPWEDDDQNITYTRMNFILQIRATDITKTQYLLRVGVEKDSLHTEYEVEVGNTLFYIDLPTP